MNLSYQDIRKSLQEQFYVNVPFPISTDILNDAIQAFFKFLDEPDLVKNHIDFTIAPKHRRGDVGFKHRNPNNHIYNDSKTFFHFHPALFEQYRDFLDSTPVVNDFMTKANLIWDLAYTTVKEVLNMFEPEFPGIVDKVFNAEHPHLLLRFLKYDWDESGEYLAKPHFDAGACTLAIAESCPGLRIGSGPENLRLISHKPENAIFMLASNFRKIMDTSAFSPGWHDVIQLDKTLVGKPCARWAIVAFIEAHNVEALPRSETHKWY